MVLAEPAPHHYVPTTMMVMLPNGDVRISLSGASLDADSPAIEPQSKCGSISKKDPCPLVYCTLLVVSCKLSLA